MRILEISLDFLFHSVFPFFDGQRICCSISFMSAVAMLIVVPEGGRAPFRYLASVDELKKTGRSPAGSWKGCRGQTAFSCGQKSKCRCNGDRYKERNDEDENRADFMRIYVA